jgi:hypothetical protein
MTQAFWSNELPALLESAALGLKEHAQQHRYGPGYAHFSL